MKPMKFSLLTFSKFFVYLVVLLGIFVFVFAWVNAPWEEIRQKWESFLAMFAFMFSVATYIIKHITDAKRLSYQQDSKIFTVEKLVWYQFKWLPEKQFAHDELLGVCAFSGSVYLIDKMSKFVLLLVKLLIPIVPKICAKKLHTKRDYIF